MGDVSGVPRGTCGWALGSGGEVSKAMLKVSRGTGPCCVVASVSCGMLVLCLVATLRRFASGVGADRLVACSA